jgi:hypothetical protein
MASQIMAVTPTQLYEILFTIYRAHAEGKVNARDASPLIIGGPGLGKSQIDAEAAVDAGCMHSTDHPPIRLPEDYTGLPFKLNDNEAAFLPYRGMRDWVQAETATVVTQEDVGQAPAMVQASLMQVVEGRRLGAHEISDKVLFSFTTNAATHNAGAGNVLSPLQNRCAVCLELQPDLRSTLVWGSRTGGIRPEFLAFLSMRPDALYDFDPSRRFEPFASPRSWAKASAMYALGFPSDLEVQVLSGALGRGIAEELGAFLPIYRSLPDPDDIINDPMNAMVPEPNSRGVSVTYALLGALAVRATVKTAGAIIMYLERLSEDFMVAGVSLMLAKNANLLAVPEVMRHREAHPDIYRGW